MRVPKVPAAAGLLAGCLLLSGCSSAAAGDTATDTTTSPTTVNKADGSRPAVAARPARQRVSGADGSTMMATFTAAGTDKQDRNRTELQLTNTSTGTRRFFIQVEPAQPQADDQSEFLDYYTPPVRPGKSFTLDLVTNRPTQLQLTSVHLCTPAPLSTVTRVGWDRQWAKKHPKDGILDVWQVRITPPPDTPTVIAEIQGKTKDGTKVSSWSWNTPDNLTEVGVRWDPDQQPATQKLTSVTVCSDWSIS